jgi:NAD(P)-dependent dehydrogenase (short-subunit alcohol dehydrogenase family)
MWASLHVLGRVLFGGVPHSLQRAESDDAVVAELADRGGVAVVEEQRLTGVQAGDLRHLVVEVAVLIGTGSIGVAIGRRAAIGRNLLLADYNETALQAMAEQLRGEGYEVTTQAADVSDHASVAADTAAALGPVTRVIHAAGVSPVQASTERVLQVDLLGTAYVLEEFGRVVATGGSGIVVASMAGHMGPGYSREVELALAYTPTTDLLGLDFLAPEAVGNSGAAYTLAKQANALPVRAAAITWGDRGARVNCISPGIIATPLARDEMSGPNAAGYRHMIDTPPPPDGWGRHRTSLTRPPFCSARTAASSPARTCSSTAA